MRDIYSDIEPQNVSITYSATAGIDKATNRGVGTWIPSGMRHDVLDVANRSRFARRV